MMFYPSQVKKTLLDEIELMCASPEEHSKAPGRDFTRTRKLPLKTMLHLFVSMGTGALQDELVDYFFHDRIGGVSSSSFNQQRQKLSPNALPHLLKSFNARHPCALYKDKYQLLAGDGTDFNIALDPGDPDTYFPPSGKSTRGYNSMGAVAVYDLLSRRFIDAAVQPARKRNEFRAGCDLIDRHEPRDGAPIFIFDRGFCSYNLFAHAQESGSMYLVRAKDAYVSRLLGAGDWGHGELDVRVERTLTRTASRKKWARPDKSGSYRVICKNVSFDYITPGQDGERTLAMRVLRFRIGDGYENIVTNLPDEFTAEEIKELYNMRWGIETSFRELKKVIGAVNFHGRKSEFVTQEIWARLILYNFCSIVAAHVVIEKKPRKHEYKLSFTTAAKACRKFLALHCGERPPDLVGLIGSCILPVRPNRRFERRHMFQTPFSFAYRY